MGIGIEIDYGMIVGLSALAYMLLPLIYLTRCCEGRR